MVVLGGVAVSCERGTPVQGYPELRARTCPKGGAVRPGLQGYLAHKKQAPLRTLRQAYD